MRAFSLSFCLSIVAVFWLAEAVLVPAEQAFLQDLYNSIIDRPASWQLSSLTTNPCPPWQGVICTADTQHINQLIMANTLGRGSIPDSIGNLTSVTVINFGNNMLSGTIPSTISNLKTVVEVHFESNFLTGPLPDIGQMTAIQRAYFSSNSLSGTIPPSIGLPINFIELNLASNSLSGSIPDSICNLTNLWNFFAFSNSLTGSIPSCIGNMTTLYQIQVFSNYLTGSIPPSFGQLNNLLLIHIGNNDLSGTIPVSLCNVKSLSYLYLFNNRLSGTIPECIGQLVKLTDFQVQTNQLSGSLPASTWELQNLVNLILSGNKLDGVISEGVGNLSRLRILQLFDNQLSGSIPAAIGNLEVIETIYFHNNLFSGAIPESLFGLPRMSTLTLSNNRFTGTLSPLIGQAQRLENFQLYQNQFYGSIPTEIGQLSGLRYFFAHVNAFTGSLPDSIGNLAQLEQLYLSSNMIDGSIPASINNLAKLTILYLGSNKLEGTLPALNNLKQLGTLQLTQNVLEGTFPDISNLVNLKFLFIGGNAFSGTLPNEWSKLSKLQQISADNNRFEGTIPNDIGNLPLTILTLDQNILTGTMPSSVGSLSLLQTFTLTGNKLSGTLPAELGGLKSLAVVSFASNDFSGTIPREFSELTQLTDVYLGVNQLEGEIPSFPNATLKTLSAVKNRLTGCTPAFTRKPSVCDLTDNLLDCNCFDSSACVKFLPNECVTPLEPSAFSPDNILALALGVALGGAVAIGAVLFGVFFSRYRNKKKGLLVELTEPDYSEVAFGKELVMKYKINNDDKYKSLEDIMMNRDRTFVSILINCTAPTELDMVARSLIFLAHHHNTAAELIEYFASLEIMRASSENTIFRTDNMASKMFKFYSKVVGVKYLFEMLARVINELEAITKEPEADREAARRSGVSMLNVDMEMDPNKMEEGMADKDANALQLALTCQRIISVIINAEGRVPGEFRRIFTRMQATIMSKFGSEDAVFKAVGGFLFLRFICPSITVPHAYGLTQAPPNQRCQRQLVLIAKVLQHVANMATVTKEAFMGELTDFVNKNIPKVKGFYGELLNWSKIGNTGTHRALEVPEEVRLNALAELHEFIVRNDLKMRDNIAEIEDDEVKSSMNQVLDSIVSKYGEEPKRLGTTDEKKKKGKSDTEQLL